MSQLTAMRSRVVGHNGFPPSGLSAKDNYNQQHEITTSSSDEFNPRQIANHENQFVRSPPPGMNEYSHLGGGTTRMADHSDVGSNRIYEEVHLNDGKTKVQY